MSSPRYFQGKSVTGHVEASKAQTFREVVDRLRLAPTLGITHGAFLALGKEGRNEVKKVAFFVPAIFDQSPSPRQTSHALHCNLIFLDIDPEMEMKEGKWVETGRYPAAPFVNNPDALYDALEGFNFAAHTTASSTAAKPRMRIVVDAEKIPLSQYARAVATIWARLGIQVPINKESKVAVQPMFLPTMFADSKEEDHPLIAYRWDASSFLVSDIADGLFPEYADSKPETPGKNGSNGSVDSLDFLRTPVPEINLAIAKEALEKIDPDVVYDQWLECAAALKHQFSPHKAEEAFELFDEWSSGGSKYAGEQETRAKWNSLRHTPIGRVPVTVRSLLHLATQAGWDNKRVKDDCFAAVVKWLEESASVTDLMDHGAKRIVAMPLPTNAQEEVLINMLCRQLKTRFAYTISPTAIKKDVARIRQEMKAQKKPKEKANPLFSKGVCYVSNTNELLRVHTGEKYKPERFDRTYGHRLLPTEESLKEAGKPITAATLATPIMPPSDYLLYSLQIPKVYDYAYNPAEPTEKFFVNDAVIYVNTYRPTYPEFDPAGAAEAGNLFVQHLENLIAEPEYRRILTDWLAYLVQFPGRKIRWAVFIQGIDGSGKTFLAKAAEAVLGSGNVKCIDGEAIKKGWTEWAVGAQLIAMEDIRVTGHNRHEVMNTLKPFITNDTIAVNERNRATRQVLNITNYIVFSNHHDALALTPGDRRYFVVKSALQHRAQVLALGENYFPTLFGMLRDNAGALRSWLNDWQISPDFRADGHAPRTIYTEQMINDSAHDLMAAIRRLLRDGDNPLVQYDIVSAKTILDMLHLEEGFDRCTGQSVAHALREEGYKQIGRHLFGTERHYVWIRDGVDEITAPQIAAYRQKAGLRNLEMQMIYGQ